MVKMNITKIVARSVYLKHLSGDRFLEWLIGKHQKAI